MTPKSDELGDAMQRLQELRTRLSAPSVSPVSASPQIPTVERVKGAVASTYIDVLRSISDLENSGSSVRYGSIDEGSGLFRGPTSTKPTSS
jgi:hypothetical protein